MNKDLERAPLPLVSVIVPVYNDLHRIGTCIRALLSQTYPNDRYEVLVVDNGSIDGTPDLIRQYPVTLLFESRIQTSYAARNKGITQARGEILAFTDSDCTPVPAWLEEGVSALKEKKADLAGGNVRFIYSTRPTSAEIFDSITNMQVGESIRDRRVAKTANLFVRESVFKSNDLFPEDMESGGDIFWTRQATSRGAKIVYAPRAEVGHPTRKLLALLKKQYRVGKGHHSIRARERKIDLRPTPHPASLSAKVRQGWDKTWRAAKGFLPPPFSKIAADIRRHDIAADTWQLYKVWLVSWLCQIVTSLGSLSMTVRRTAGISALSRRSVDV